jgi:acylphosphatase
MVNYKIKVIGKVQGVFFRKSTLQVAEQLGVKGWVKNEEDASVLIEAEADKEVIDKFIQWCHKGPAGAKVSKVEVMKNSIKRFTDFKIIY